MSHFAHRRDFLKTAGALAAGLGVTALAKSMRGG